MVMRKHEISNKIYINNRVTALKFKAFERQNVPPQRCHIGHIALQGMLESPNACNQIDGATGKMETNISVATRSCRLASAMTNYGLKPGDAVFIMDKNHMDIAIPYFACHFNGYSMSAMDPSAPLRELEALFSYICPKMVFCPTSCVEKVREALATDKMQAELVIFDDREADLEAFIKKKKGSEIGFVPADFDHSLPAWLILTSGTTGIPKVAMIPFETLLNGVCRWWLPFTERIESIMIMASLQWLSSLLFFIGGPIRGFTRIQSSDPLSPQLLVSLINKYKPQVTAWTPFLLGQFLAVADKLSCDLSCFKYIVIGGSAIDKPLLEKFKEKCKAYLYLVYGASELLVPIFDFIDSTPTGSTGLAYDCFQYKLVDNEDHVVDKPFQSGELWVKGDSFFTGYLNNPEETKSAITEDGWVKTGDVFYKDEQDFYFFVERKKLLMRHYGYWIAPLVLEEAVKRHPGVEEACALGIPNPECMELPVVAILRKPGMTVDPEEIFALIRGALPDRKHILSMFFVDSFPITPSGKIHRAKVKEIALTVERILAKE